MARQPRARRVRRVYEFNKDHRDQFDVTTMCRVLGVARAGYYAWLKEPFSDRAKEDACLLALIKASYKASHGVCGSRRIFLDLREAGETCSKHRVERLMRQNNIKALHGYRHRYQAASKPSAAIPNLLQRNFDVIRLNTAWVTDITYNRTWEGWLNLAVVMDLFSRKIFGWAAAATLHRELILDAVVKAVRSRRPKRATSILSKALSMAATTGNDFVLKNRLEPSMSRRGNCWALQTTTRALRVSSRGSDARVSSNTSPPWSRTRFTTASRSSTRTAKWVSPSCSRGRGSGSAGISMRLRIRVRPPPKK